MAIMTATFHGSAAEWCISQEQLCSVDLENFRCHIKAEYLPVHYQRRFMNELRWRTQHPDECFIEHTYSMQQQMDQRISDSLGVEKVARVLRQFYQWNSA